jgi:hypothetical protein
VGLVELLFAKTNLEKKHTQILLGIDEVQDDAAFKIELY